MYGLDIGEYDMYGYRGILLVDKKEVK